jgi:hypothetical protein
VICILDIFHILFAIERPFCAGFVAPVAHRALGSAPLSVPTNCQWMIFRVSKIMCDILSSMRRAIPWTIDEDSDSDKEARMSAIERISG